MQKLNQVPPAWEADAESFNNPEEWEKGKLLVRLKEEGQTAIAVDRAVLVIEQCDREDDFPKGWSHDPLKISIYSDPDVTGDTSPSELYIHAGRMGPMQLLLNTKGTWAQNSQNEVYQLVPVKVDAMRSLETIGDVTKAQTILTLIKHYLSGFYYISKSPNAATPVADESLAALKKEAEDAIEAYLEHLKTRPNLHPGWPHPVLD